MNEKIKQEKKKAMVKSKKDLDKDREKFLSQAREGLKELKDCDFEEFKEHMIELGEQLLAGQFMMMEWLGEERQKLFNQAVDCIKQIKATNDKDFKIVEKKFKEVDKEINSLMHQASKAEAMGLCSMLYTNGAVAALGKRGLLTDEALQEGLTLVPKRVKKHIANVMRIKISEVDKTLLDAIQATV
ncbi:MAG TPA: hypothetical protein VMW09_00160 [Desulfatiglandales bacterium]|nr:hypothetical protein [Desulfatiglandales bacterium]